MKVPNGKRYKSEWERRLRHEQYSTKPNAVRQVATVVLGCALRLFGYNTRLLVGLPWWYRGGGGESNKYPTPQRDCERWVTCTHSRTHTELPTTGTTYLVVVSLQKKTLLKVYWYARTPVHYYTPYENGCSKVSGRRTLRVARFVVMRTSTTASVCTLSVNPWIGSQSDHIPREWPVRFLRNPQRSVRCQSHTISENRTSRRFFRATSVSFHQPSVGAALTAVPADRPPTVSD
jgi:hypothetical protein